jgi:hypothetical protein
MAEWAWCSRTDDELSGLRVLSLVNGSQYLRLRFDGGEFSSDDDPFLDVMVWASDPQPWEALFVGTFESHAVLFLAGFMVDASQDWLERDEVHCSVEPGGFAATVHRGSPSEVTLSLYPGGKRDAHKTVGDFAPPSIQLTNEQLLDAAEWLCTEASRFMPDKMIGSSGWVPEDPAFRVREVLVPRRQTYLDSQPRTVDEALAQLREGFAEALADPDMGPERRHVIEYLARRLDEADGSGSSV